jgi:hypothetical protein
MNAKRSCVASQRSKNGKTFRAISLPRTIGAAAARERLRGEDAALRKGYVRQFVERIEVDDHEIRIIGPTANLAGGVPGSGRATASGVPSFDKGWWARQDSNLRQHRYERRVLTN